MREPITGVQLYTLRDHIQTALDFDRTLARLREMGVRDVQISGIGAQISTKEIQTILKNHEMRVCVTHQSFDRLCSDLPAVIDLHHAIGCDAVGLGYAPEQCRDTLEHAKQFVETLHPIAQTLQQHGLQLHYHNHDFEFTPLPHSDRTFMDLLLEMEPSLLFFIPDVAWLQVAGVDPTAWMRARKGRIKVVHFKDYVPKRDGRPQFVSLGHGVIDLKGCFSLCRALEIPYIVYEQDDGWEHNDPFKSTETSLRYFELLHNM